MELISQYVILFRKARTDLKAAKILLKDIENGDDELDLDVIMFHLHQSIEKLLKSLLAYNKLHFTKTHGIDDLINSVKENKIEITSDVERLIPLTDYAVEGRYAIIHDDLDDADKYIAVLDELVKFVKEAIDA